jgi:adenylate kinase family enzyme
VNNWGDIIGLVLTATITILLLWLATGGLETIQEWLAKWLANRLANRRQPPTPKTPPPNHQRKAHHLALIGETGSGKTTFAEEYIHSKRGEFIIIANKPKRWFANTIMPYSSDENGITEIIEAMEMAMRELRSRIASMRDGMQEDDFEPLFLVIDDLPDLRQEMKAAGRLEDFDWMVRKTVQLGRELQIHLVGLAQTFQVRDWGLEGRGENRANLYQVRFGQQATNVLPEAAKSSRPCVSMVGAEWITLTLPEITPRPIDPGRQFSPPENAENAELENSAPERPEPEPELVQVNEKAAIIRRLKERSLSKNEIIRIVFDAKPGGSAAYRRACAIYEEALNNE